MLELYVNGPPGAGKTSLCKLLCDELNLVLVSTGDLLRENILQRTELGRIAKECISAKSLVPDHVVVDMVAEKILECTLKRQGWVLDGFPRTVDQSSALRRKQIYPSVVFILELTEQECAKRITGRRFDPITSKIYHMPSIMPRDPSVLTRLTKRSDDAADKLPPRLEAYRQYGERTNALFASVSHRINVSNKSPEQVLESVMALLHSIRPSSGPQANNPSTTTTTTNTSTIPTSEETNDGNQSSLIAPLAIVTRPIASQPIVPKKRLSMPQKIEEGENEQEDVDEDPFHYDDLEDTSVAVSEPRLSCIPSSVSSSYEDEPRLDQTMEHLQSTTISGSSPSQQEQPELTFSNNDAIHSLPLSRPSLCPPKLSSSCLFTETDLIKFKDMLLDGFEVLKHGRRGSPHLRMIFTDMEMKRVFWIKPTKEPKAKKARLDQSLLLTDVIQVVRGMKTEVLKRSGDVSKYEKYLSLVAEDRTLDLEFPTESLCAFLLYGFEQVLHR